MDCPTLSFPVEKGLYPNDILLKAAYAFLDRVYIHFEETSEEWLVFITSKDPKDKLEEVKAAFENELISQTVRKLVYNQTHTLRELFFARAMASSIVDEEDPMERVNNEQQRDISDEELHQILTEWFSKNEEKGN